MDRLYAREVSALEKYREVFVGRPGLGALLAFELITGLCGSVPGALGLWLRASTYRWMVRAVGGGVFWGRDIALRHPWRIAVGDRVVIDDHCLLDARGSEEGIRIGNDVLIARDTIIQAKTGGITIGDGCTISSQCQLSSVGGIHIGRAALIAGQCYIGGGRYHTKDPATLIKDQGLYTKGPVVIGDDTWVGAGVVILDGVRIGRGSVIGAGAVVREDVPAFTIVVHHKRLLMFPRGESLTIGLSGGA